MPTEPVKDFLGIVDFPDKKMGPLCYDEEWLSILRATHSPLFFAAIPKVPPQYNHAGTKAQREEVKKRYTERGYSIKSIAFPLDAPTSPLPADISKKYTLPSEFTQDKQTIQFINELGLPFPGFGNPEIPKVETPVVQK